MSARRAYFSIPPAVKTDRPQKSWYKINKKNPAKQAGLSFEALSNQQNNIYVLNLI